MTTTIFVLKDKKPQSWAIKYRGLMIEKKTNGSSGLGLKQAGYFPGQDSIFVEDVYKINKDLTPQSVPDFEFNPATNRTELVVKNTNKNLITLLINHPWFNKRYEIFSEEIESEKALASFDLKEKALELLKTDDPLEIKAKAMVVFGYTAYAWIDKLALSKLKQLAFEKPEKILVKLQAKDFQSHYIASMAFILGVVKNNIGHTSVVWSDTEKAIIGVAKGENGNEKLGEFISNQSDESIITLQEISKRINASKNQEWTSENFDLNKSVPNKELELKIQEKDNEIERLKALLTNVKKESVYNSQEGGGSLEDLPIEDLSRLYNEKFGKELSLRYKNDKDWILSKLNV